MGRKGNLTLLLVFTTALTPSLQYPRIRRDQIPLEKDDGVREEYEEVDVTATRQKDFGCKPEDLLGFPDPKANVTWDYKQESSTFTNDLMGPNVLESSNVRMSDAGNYTCTVTSSNGTTVKKTFDICITRSEKTKDPPVTGSISPETYKPIGYSVSFTCRAYVGCPRCLNPFNYSVSWSKLHENGNRIQLVPSDEIDITQYMEDNGVMFGQLEIKRVRSSDYATYECIITNENGPYPQNVTLTDKVPPAVLRDRFLWIACSVLIFVCFFMPMALCCSRHISVEIALRRRSKFDPSVADRYVYDVLVVNGPTSDTWVWEILQPVLEEDCHYKCYFPKRDMIGGEDSIQCIPKTVGKCRHVMVVVTHCLLKDANSIWTIIQANEEAMNTSIIPVILQPIKKKQHHTTHHKDVLSILSQRKSVQVRVPASFKPKQLDKEDQDIMHQQLQETRREHAEVRDEMMGEVKSVDSRLLRPEGECKVRSRSKSPKDQRVKNMIIAANECSMTSFVIDRDTLKVSKGGDREDERRGGSSETEGKTKRDIMINVSLKHESEEDEQDYPGTPCSMTPFINSRDAPHLRRRVKGSRVWKWVRAYAGDDEELFLKILRLRLSPPMHIQRETMLREVDSKMRKGEPR